MFAAPVFQLVTRPCKSVVMMAVSVAPLTICLQCHAAMCGSRSSIVCVMSFRHGGCLTHLRKRAADRNFELREENGRHWPDQQRTYAHQVPSRNIKVPQGTGRPARYSGAGNVWRGN